MWKHVRNISGNNNDRQIPKEINVENERICEGDEVIEKLNLFFSKISEKRVSEHPQQDLPFDFDKLTSYVNAKVPDNIKFTIPLMKNTDLISIIGSLDATKATGLDGITPKILKKSADIVNPSLLKIINISISTGQFPDLLKVAKIIPIHKSGAQDDPANYRPISILSIISKVIEKHVTKHLFANLNKYSLFHKSQSGFRKHHSCNTALINLIDRWLNSIDKGDIIGAVFFDLRKAFDVVDHDLLLEKLAAYKFSTTSQNWIQSYLTNRKQCIVNQNIRSSLQIVKSGVPHGSVLGPVLFVLFVDDLPMFIKEVYLDVYADDDTVHASGKKQNVIVMSLTYKLVQMILKTGACQIICLFTLVKRLSRQPALVKP